MDATYQRWLDFLQQFPEAHVLQTAEWGVLKSRFGWDVDWVITPTCGAQILFRKLLLGITIAYIPKGPVGQVNPDFWKKVDEVCRSHHAVFLKIETDSLESEDGNQFPASSKTSEPIQPRKTSILDLTQSTDELLAGMKQKTRYNIQLAAKKDVVVTSSDDLKAFSDLMLTTGERDQFGTHSPGYYQQAYDIFHPIGACELFIARYQDIPLAGVMVFRRGTRCWYFYGASSNLERNRMPAYLVQWEAILWAKTNQCEIYDLWGIPDFPDDELESDFMDRSDGLWGVYRFKRGFGGKLVRSQGAVDRVYNHPLYKMYEWANRIRRPGGMG